MCKFSGIGLINYLKNNNISIYEPGIIQHEYLSSIEINRILGLPGLEIDCDYDIDDIDVYLKIFFTENGIRYRYQRSYFIPKDISKTYLRDVKIDQTLI